MDSRTQAEIASIVAVKQFLVDHPTLKTNNVELATESDSMDENLTDALSAGNVKGKIAAVNSNDVSVAKQQMSDTIMNILGKGIVKCRQIPTNKSLALKLTKPANFILEATQITAVEHANEMIDLLEVPANKTYLSNITALEVTAAKALVTKYDGIKEVPVLTIKNKKDNGTVIVKQKTSAGRMNVLNIITLVKSDCEFTDPNMLSGIIHAATVIVLGVRHTPTNIIVKDALTGKGIMDAKSTEQLRKKLRVLYSNTDGLVELETHKAGAFEMIFSQDGYEDFLLKGKIARRVLNVFEVRMKRLIS